MSPADAKRGAKRRKNKRGGGGKAGPAAALRGSQAAGLAAPGGAAAANGPLGAGAGGAAPGGYFEAPFSFGLSHRAPPYPTGDCCLLCRSERKDPSFLESGMKASSKLALTTAAKGSSALHLPLWVCPGCRRTVEKEERLGNLDPPAGQDFLLHSPLGTAQPEAGGRLALGAPTLPSAGLGSLTDTTCACEACSERRESPAEPDREPQQLQNYWSEVRYTVRCIYRQAGTPLADDQDQPLVPDKEGVKALVDRLCEQDPYQLYQRLEQQAREYVLEMKVRLLHQLSAASRVKAPTGLQGPPQAHQFISLLLEEYGALCQAARTISTFLGTLENEHLKKFQVTWELHNKHLFENLVFSEPLLQSNLPALVSQIRLGSSARDARSEDAYSALLRRFQHSEEELRRVAEEWLRCQQRIDAYVDEQALRLFPPQMTEKTKQRLLTGDWELLRQRQLLEEQLTSKKAVATENNFTDAMRHVLSSRLSLPDCPNCSYRRRCACDDCSLSHILTCGIVEPPVTGDVHAHQLPLHVDAPPDRLSEMRPPSTSPASSGSGSSSLLAAQPHSRLLLPGGGSVPAFCSDDEDVAPLSAKFADIYPLSSYDDAGVAAGMNGAHGGLNGAGENLALKDESPQVSSTSSSSSDADDEDADGESGGEPVVALQEAGVPLGDGSPGKEDSKGDSPPPSYPAQQAEQAPSTCECHVCKQEASGLSTSAMTAGALPPGHQFVSPEKPTHPALHLYPHIHGHVPLHAVPHLPRPLIHPTLYTAPPFTHNKALPPAPVQNHTNKHQVFSASLQDHIYPSCFGSTPEWNSSKFISLWGAQVMNDKDWNPGTFLPDAVSGSDVLGPTLSETRPEALPPPSSNETPAESKEKKNAARKKCLYNFQDAFTEASKVVMATSSATSSVSCTATTVQSSNSQFRVSSKRPPSVGDVFHGISKEDHRHAVPAAPRSSPTGLAPLPTLAPAPTPHLGNLPAPAFPKTATTAPGFVEPRKSFCPGPVVPPPPSTDGSVSAPPSVCSDPDCGGHRCENGTYDPQQDDGDESGDEDSCSEHSSSTSTSTNQKEGKYCDCCYCEFFGHGGPPAAPTSRNYAEMREKLRLRLTKRKEEQPKKADPLSEREGLEDHRRVEDLLRFINSSEPKPVSSARAAKRARHKQRKLEEKARLEAEARAREHLHLREEQRRREEEEERLKEELRRLQELQKLRAAKKKKKERPRKDCPKLDILARSFQAATESAPSSENFHNGSLEQAEEPEASPHSSSRHTDHMEPRPGPGADRGAADPGDPGDPVLLPSKGAGGKPQEPLSFLLDTVQPHAAGAGGQEEKPPRQSSGELTRKPAEPPRLAEAQPRLRPESKARGDLPSLVEQRREERKANNNNNNKKQLNPVPSEPGHPGEPQGSTLVPADSPQPKGRSKKNKKKKGDRAGSSLDDVFLPKDIDLDSVDMDETEREVEYFKRFCLDSARQTRQRLSINWSNFSLKKATFAAH